MHLLKVQGAGKGEETKEAKMGAVQVRTVQAPPRLQLCGNNMGIPLLPSFIPSGNPTVLFSVEILCPLSSRKFSQKCTITTEESFDQCVNITSQLQKVFPVSLERRC